MWSDESSTYNYNSKQNESVRKADEQLVADIAELKKEIETNELVHGLTFARPFASVPSPKDPKLAERERKIYIEKLLRVNDTRPLYIQADVMQEHIENAIKDEYTMESLPILLHQFFLDKINWCVNAKHAHMLRWKRFSEHTGMIEDMYIEFKNRISFILSDYNDSIKRAERLSAARESLLLNGSCNNAYTSIDREDLEIYLRWLICHFYSQHSFQQAIKTIEWLPIEISTEHFATFNKSSTSNPNANSVSYASSNEDGNVENKDTIESLYRTNIESSSYNYSSNVSNSISSTMINKYKMLDHIYLPFTNALVPRDEILNSISYLFSQDDVPIHNNKNEFLLPRLRYLVNYYKVDYNLARLHSVGDEMELYAAVTRRFKVIFNQQEQMKKFRIYDLIEEGAENWGSESPSQALKKEAKWVDFIQIKPCKDPVFEKEMAKLKLRNLIDQFILPHNSFIEVNSDERVSDCLRENANVTKNFSSIVESTLSLNPQTISFNTSTLWKKIFYNTNITNKDENSLVNNVMTPMDANEDNSQPRTISFRAKPMSKKLDDFNFIENLQKLGLDDSKTSDTNLTNVQGTYLAFLLLRHLRIRDLKRQALGLLNYFRSIEKTITIYDGGLSAEAKGFKRQSAQNHMKETSYGNNLGYHAYMYNTPKDFKISEAEFMEYNEIENHDDFYSVDEREFIHVQDQRGYYVVYDAALNDLKALENDLILIASYFIAKDKETMMPSANTNKNQKKFRKTTPDLTLNNFSHLNVDRFAVLCDIWTNEINFLEMKKNLINIYYEAYQNVFDTNERRSLAQVITNLIYKRARIDLNANYFSQSYRYEVSSMHKQCSIVKLIFDRMIDEMRSLMEKLEPNGTKYGLPLSVIKKNLICLTPNSNGSTLKNLYLLEFHPCLACASRLPDALKYAIEELNFFKSTTSVNQRLHSEINYLTKLHITLQNLQPPGHSFATHIQKEVFTSNFADDPLLMNDFVDFTVRQLEEQAKNKTKKEQQEILLGAITKIVEMVTLRQRLLNASLDTEILAKIYKKQANEMGFEDFHMFQRYIQLDFAKYKDNASDPPPMFVGEINMEDPSIDRYVPSNLLFVISELEEGSIAKLSFKGKENIQQTCLKPGGMENLQIILRLQIAHNSALIASIMQSNYCYMSLNLEPRTEVITKTDQQNKSDDSAKNFLQKFVRKNEELKSKRMSTTDTSTLTSNLLESGTARLKQFSESFVSVQIEKNQFRDLLINDFIKQKQQKGTLILSNPIEMEKLKRKLFNDFASRFTMRICQYSMRTQLIALYYSITKLLENFPNTRRNHFVFGEPFEKRLKQTNNKPTIIIEDESQQKQEEDEENLDYLKPNASIFKKRPRKLLSDDGERVLNLWFIPHYTEIITMFKRRNDEFSCKTLKFCVRIIGALNEILQFIYAMACINVSVVSSASASSSTSGGGGDGSTAQLRRKLDFSTWENSGGLENELTEIQLEMNQLNDPCSPEQVAELLETKRNSLFLQFDCAIRYSVQDLFLASSNLDTFKLVNENSNFPLKFLNEYYFDTPQNVYFSMPDPFDLRDHYSKKILPYRTDVSKYGPFAFHYWQWYLIEQNVTMCLNGLKDVEKNMANGEMLGVMLMMEDLILGSKTLKANDVIIESKPATATPASAASQRIHSNRGSRLSITPSVVYDAIEETDANEIEDKPDKNKHKHKNKSRTSALIMNYKNWCFFLLTWKRLELLKTDWARRKLGVENLNTPEIYAKFSENYRKDILLPVLKILVKSTDHQEIYDNVVDFKQPLLLPPDISELESKSKQITRLLERLDLTMIDETIHRVQRDLKLSLSERSREENSLTTDLWKKSIIKEEFTISKPHILDEFTSFLQKKFNNSSEENKSVIYKISENDLKECLNKLGLMIHERERYNYEQYALFYENLLRNNHQLLYAKEREIIYMKNAIESQKSEINVEVQCQMADSCFNLIMEVTALRAKMFDTEVNKEKLEKELRDEIKSEFIDLVTDLVNVNTSLKAHIDRFKETIHSNVIELLTEARKNMFDQVITLKSKSGKEIDENVKEAEQNQINLIAEMTADRAQLANLLIMQKCFAKLKQFKNASSFNKKISELTEISNLTKKRTVDISLILEQKQTLIVQQKQAIKKQLAKLDAEYTLLKLKLDKEQKEKLTREHENQQRIKNERNLNSAKQFNVEKLFEELTQKDFELRQLHLVTEKSSKMQSINDNRIQRELTNLKKNLTHERNLKLDAFQRVDQLQSHLFDLEDEVNAIVQTNRPHTSITDKVIKSALRSNISSSLQLNTNSKHSSPFPRLFNGTTNLTQSTSSNSMVHTAAAYQENKPFIRPKTTKLINLNQSAKLPTFSANTNSERKLVTFDDKALQNTKAVN